MDAKQVDRIKRVSVAEEIVLRLLKMIEGDILKPGEMLPTEKELMEMFGVGRSSVREALRALQYMGLVEKHQGMGTYVSSTARTPIPSFNVQSILERYTLTDLSQARMILEEQITALSSQHATQENIDAMRRENDRLRQLLNGGTKDEIISCDQAVHRAIADGAQNEFLTEMLEMLSDIYMDANRAVLTRDKIISAIVFHDQVIDCIAEKDARGARRAMTAHLLDVQNRIFASYDEGRQIV
jgi:GntR family transcriptional repressor for pyruvate dehydrogenase complex